MMSEDEILREYRAALGFGLWVAGGLCAGLLWVLYELWRG